MQNHYLTGHPLIDAQHDQMFALLDLLTFSARANDRESLLQALEGLMSHVISHFADEEALQLACGFGGPSLAHHKGAHDAIILLLDGLIQDYKDPSLKEETLLGRLEQMVTAFLSQLEDYDRPLAEYLNK